MCSDSSRSSLASEAPIGIFDSGIGGLTVAHAVSRALPNERIHYFGDTAHMPYGDRSPELVRAWSLRIAEHLVNAGCKAIVIACNSASTTAAAEVAASLGAHIPVVDVVSPVVQAVAKGPWSRIGVIGTRATIGSGVYGTSLRSAMELNGKAGLVEEWPTPLLAPLIEEGWHDHELMVPVIQSYIDAAGWRLEGPQSIDALIPGCTHYPLALDALRHVVGENIGLINGPEIVAKEVCDRLEQTGLNAPAQSKVRHRFAVSDLTLSFTQSAERFFGSGIDLQHDPIWG